MTRPNVGDAIQQPALRPFSIWRRAAALVLDVIIFAPPIAFFCVAGSFDTESSHHGFSWLYIIALAIGCALPACEILCAGSPGLLLLRGRIRRGDGSPASAPRLAARAALKYAPLLTPYIAFGFVLLLIALHLRDETAVAAAAIALLLVLIGYVALIAIRRRWQTRTLPAWWFDRYTDTRVFHVRPSPLSSP